MAVNKLLQSALEYYDQGLNILPLFSNSKDISLSNHLMPEYVNQLGEKKRGWGAYKNKRPEREKIEEWFNQMGVTGIALVTGEVSGLTVVDVDSYKGVKDFSLTSEVVASTPSGGTHLYFQHNPDIGQKGYVEGVNIEIKGTGGYVVAPPSRVIIKGEGRGYKWVSPFSREKLPILDKSFIKDVWGEVNHAITNYDELIKVPEGGRHLAFRTLCLAMWNSKQKVLWGYAENMLREIGLGYDPPMDIRSIDKLIQDTQRFVANNPKEAKAELEVGLNPIVPQKPQEWFERRKELAYYESLAPSTGFLGLDSIMRGFVPGTLYALSGLTNVGKTGVCCTFAANLEKQQKKTLYLALEPDVRILDSLASARTGKPYKELEGNDVYTPSEYIDLLDRKQIDSIGKMVKAIETSETHYDLVIIDHLGYFITEGKNPTQEQANQVKRLVDVAMEKKTAIIMVLHFNKQGAKKGGYDQTNIGGSNAFTTDAQTVLLVGRDALETSKGFTEYQDVGGIVVTKNKSGLSGVRFDIRFTPLGARFYDNTLDNILKSEPIEEKITEEEMPF